MAELFPRRHIVLEEGNDSHPSLEQEDGDYNFQIEEQPLEQYESQKLTILHVSDLQFGWEKDDKGLGIANRKVYESLIRTFRDNISSLGEWHPDLIIISGNISYHGISEEYNNCKTYFIEPLVNELGLDLSRVITCPGNSDIMLSNVGRYERPSPNNEDDDISDINWDNISSDRQNHFHDYLDYFGNGDFRNFCRVYSFPQWEWFKILSMNSAWDCRGSEETDRGRLRLGRTLVKEFIDGLKSEKYCKCALVLNHPIGSIYHDPQDYSQSRPYTWFHCSEWPNIEKENSVKSQIMNNIDYSLSGHLDYIENVTVDPIGRTIRLLDGKYYINKSVGYGYLCRLVNIGRYTNTQYRELTTLSSKYEDNWNIGRPTNVTGENDSPIKAFGNFFPVFVEITKLAEKGKIDIATKYFLKYLFGQMIINNNSLNLDDEFLNKLCYQINNRIGVSSSSPRDAESSFEKNDLEGR